VTDEFVRLRAEIDENDRAIVAAVNTRLRLVAELWELKREQGHDRLDPERERLLREQLASTNTGPLSQEGLDRLVDELLGLTKRELGGTS
jgi:3-deoxy-7-phosphoheptulonate synthase / chorismate mutase